MQSYRRSFDGGVVERGMGQRDGTAQKDSALAVYGKVALPYDLLIKANAEDEVRLKLWTNTLFIYTRSGLWGKTENDASGTSG